MGLFAVLPYPQIDPALFRLGPLAFRWYGLMYVLGFIGAYFVIRRLARERSFKLPDKDLSALLGYAVLGVLLGARLGYVLVYGLSDLVARPWSLFAVWEGGMSFHGGMLGMILAGWLFSRRRGYAFYTLADMAVVAVPIGLGLGRIGNFINGELYGQVTEVPWAMVFPGGGPLPRHPSQLYEAFLEGVVLFAVLWALSRRHRPPGMAFWSFLMLYGVFRFFVEFFREPDAHLGLVLGPFSMGQVLSLPMLILGMGMVFLIRWRRRSGSAPESAGRKHC